MSEFHEGDWELPCLKRSYVQAPSGPARATVPESAVHYPVCERGILAPRVKVAGIDGAQGLQPEVVQFAVFNKVACNSFEMSATVLRFEREEVDLQ